MIPTPDLSHLKKADYEHVYEPAEDTFILLDALEEDADVLRQTKPLVCLEIGSGSGCVSSFVSAILGPSCLYISTDINPYAALATLRTGHQNKTTIDPILGSLAGPLRSRLHRKIDLLVFNPPYVPTVDEEVHDAQGGRDIEGSWAGGKDGMQITDVLLDQLDDLLSPEGRFYLVAVKENDVPGIQDRMLSMYGIQSKYFSDERGENIFL